MQDPQTPVIFADGTAFYADLSKKYIQHSHGLFILAPSGAGKTYFVSHQTESHWIDGDDLWPAAGADPTNDEWESDFALVQEINDRSDIITHQAKKLGFWIVGSSNHHLKPDAIVLPPWEKHVTYITNRESSHYDGGAKQADLQSVQEHRAWIAKWEDQGVPRFDSVDDAVAFLVSKTT